MLSATFRLKPLPVMFMALFPGEDAPRRNEGAVVGLALGDRVEGGRVEEQECGQVRDRAILLDKPRTGRSVYLEDRDRPAGASPEPPRAVEGCFRRPLRTTIGLGLGPWRGVL